MTLAPTAPPKAIAFDGQQPEEALDVSPTATGRQLSDVLTSVRGLHG
ncbi:MAG TPA: hypothetical protein VN639_20290 [Azonexus sp.]|nr:hypothetical protein [Azonexus sp.]